MFYVYCSETKISCFTVVSARFIWFYHGCSSALAVTLLLSVTVLITVVSRLSANNPGLALCFMGGARGVRGSCPLCSCPFPPFVSSRKNFGGDKVLPGNHTRAKVWLIKQHFCKQHGYLCFSAFWNIKKQKNLRLSLNVQKILKCFSFRVFASLTPDQRLCPWTSLNVFWCTQQLNKVDI